VTAAAIVLVLVAAFLHATWNLCAKRAGGGLPFVWMAGGIICLLYVPVVAFWILHFGSEYTAPAVLWIAGSGALKTAYSLFLQRSYRAGEFSLIYPVARGTGPLLATFGAIVLFSERPSLLALGGALLIIASVFHIAGGARVFHEDRAHLRGAFAYGLTCGACIASYTLWDRHGVAGLSIAPVLYDAGTSLTQFVLLSPFALRRLPEVRAHWRDHARYVLGMAVLSPVAYVLVLTAMSFTPVSYVAPAREVSIVIGAWLGAKVLREGEVSRRMSAAAAMAAGLVALALG